METKELLRILTDVNGVSGREGNVADVAKEILSEYMDVKIDNMGSVIGHRDGKGKHILLDAHIDQIGLVVTAIDDNGFLKVNSVGGVDRRILTANRLTVRGKEQLLGIVCSTPPHLAKGDDSSVKEISEFFIDIGMNAEKAREVVSVGDAVTYNQTFCELMNGRVTNKSLDDRAGIAVLLKAVEYVKEEDCDAKLSVLFSVQEEVGTRGAGAGAYSLIPDEAIAVDVSFAFAPDIPKHKCGEIDGGAMIGVSPILSTAMTNELKRIAKENNIPHSLEIMGGETGTNADAITLTAHGIPTALISIPQRNMHTPVELVSVSDVESCARLIADYIIENGGSANA